MFINQANEHFIVSPPWSSIPPWPNRLWPLGSPNEIFPTLVEDMDKCNVIEIEGLLFPGFGPMCALHGKLVFPIKCHHEGAQKWSSLVEKF